MNKNPLLSISISLRAKRRRLAQALSDKPAVLADGRSPGPRVIADRLLALRKAGAARISAPVCAD